MMADLATCEWNPGANRSIVSIETAAKRVRSEDRSLLIYAFTARSWADQVTITREQITGAAQYDAVIKNMNFGTGRICRTVTRKKWKDKDAVSALVFLINGRSYGYASACGNLFQLSRLPDSERSAPVVFVPDTPVPEEVLRPVERREQTEGSSVPNLYVIHISGNEVEVPGGGFFPGGYFPIPGYYYGTPIGHPGAEQGLLPAIPELPIWGYLGLLPAFFALRRFFRGRGK